jgi:hypothetical protein
MAAPSPQEPLTACGTPAEESAIATRRLGEHGGENLGNQSKNSASRALKPANGNTEFVLVSGCPPGSADPSSPRRHGSILSDPCWRHKMASATATQTEVNEAQSIAMIRNLMRVTFSNVVYTRGIFDPSQFKPMKVTPACHEWLA